MAPVPIAVPVHIAVPEMADKNKKRHTTSQALYVRPSIMDEHPARGRKYHIEEPIAQTRPNTVLRI